jgi:hypothetical protein
MGTNRSFQRRAREEVERIKAQEAAEEERKPSIWEEMLKRRIVDADSAAREAMARSSVNRI